MVSLKNKFGVYFFISALVLICLLIPVELKASIPCCKNGQLSTCPDLPNGQQYDISGCNGFSQGNLITDTPSVIDTPTDIGQMITGDCTPGNKQYTASGCTYKTRTCCSNGSWSSWDGPCPTTPSPVSSTVSLKLDCTGMSSEYVSFGNGSFQNYYDPTYTIPYPKCPQSNICSGKSNGYVCYQSYTSADNQCTADDSCNYWTEEGTRDESRECYWGGKASVTISIVTCK